MDALLAGELRTVLRSSQGPGRALPLWTYRSKDLFERELRDCFQRSWVFLGTSHDLPKAGGYKAVQIGKQSAVLTRSESGEVSLISNICSHRGTLLTEGEGSGESLTCPYHGWRFSLSGQLEGAPYAKTLDRSKHCLPRYRIKSWNGLFFACLDPSVPDLDVILSGFDDAMAGYQRDAFHVWPELSRTESWAANWKLVYSNSAESYHLFKVHSETLEPYAPTKWSRHVGRSGPATLTGGKMSAGGKDYLLIALPPSFVASFDGETMLWQGLRPLSPEKTEVISGLAFLSPPPENSLAQWAQRLGSRILGRYRNFLSEDQLICERGQRAAQSSFEPGTLTEMEEVLRDFHEYLGERLYPAN